MTFKFRMEIGATRIIIGPPKVTTGDLRRDTQS
jgi:hypothetical protein